MANAYVNKVQLADGTSLIDISDSTATADKILQGYTAYGADGSKLTGTATGGGGSVTQDQDGFIVLPPDGGGSPSVGGLVYETGTWTPTADVASYIIQFANTHSVAPFCYAIWDGTGTYDGTLNSNYYVGYFNGGQMFGAGVLASSSSTQYGRIGFAYRGSNASVLSGTTLAATYPYTDPDSSGTGYSRYWATETGIKAYTNSTSRYWRTGRTYKWIAVWKPTT